MLVFPVRQLLSFTVVDVGRLTMIEKDTPKLCAKPYKPRKTEVSGPNERINGQTTQRKEHISKIVIISCHNSKGI